MTQSNEKSNSGLVTLVVAVNVPSENFLFVNEFRLASNTSRDSTPGTIFHVTVT